MGTNGNKQKGHAYNASAVAFGGRLERPVQEQLPLLASISLPSVGGFASSQHKDFGFREVFSIGEAYSHLSGALDRQTGNHMTVATSVLKDVNIGHTLFARSIVAQIAVEHPAAGYHPRVSFLGSHFDGLRIGDCELKPALLHHLCGSETHGCFPKRSQLKNEGLRNFAHEQTKAFARFWLRQKGSDGKALRGMQNLDKDGENSKTVVEERGSVVCSLVDKIEGKCPGFITGGHAIYVPGFGRVFLGELRVEHGGFHLTMLRLDLGSGSAGAVSGAQASAAGRASPGAAGPRGSGGGTTT